MGFEQVQRKCNGETLRWLWPTSSDRLVRRQNNSSSSPLQRILVVIVMTSSKIQKNSVWDADWSGSQVGWVITLSRGVRSSYEAILQGQGKVSANVCGFLKIVFSKWIALLRKNRFLVNLRQDFMQVRKISILSVKLFLFLQNCTLFWTTNVQISFNIIKHCQRHYGPRRWLLRPVILVW